MTSELRGVSVLSSRVRSGFYLLWWSASRQQVLGGSAAYARQPYGLDPVLTGLAAREPPPTLHGPQPIAACANLPGTVFRVSSTRVGRPSRADTMAAVAVAIPDMRCKG